MEKKNPYKFTLGFDKTKPSHVRATEILNSVKDKADLIASALVSYIDDVRQEEGAVLSNEALQVLMDFFHSMKKLAGIYQNTKEPIFRELPFFIFTDNKDLSLEYQYRHEGVSDYITSPVNIPELIRRICYFVEE